MKLESGKQSLTENEEDLQVRKSLPKSPAESCTSHYHEPRHGGHLQP